ncbi:MAG: OsmC family protein [Arenicellales bacterium]|nr:OsmC family protein [Arenicellales bacterium]
MKINAHFRHIDDTSAALGWCGNKTIVADRRDGSAGGRGLGFSGGELQALAIGAGYCNQIRFSAVALDVEVSALSVDVEIDVEGNPPLVVSATINVRVDVDGDPKNRERLLAHAESESSISNSVTHGFPVKISTVG